jgi:TonB-linked SusC/RagA family outer membrane protein
MYKICTQLLCVSHVRSKLWRVMKLTTLLLFAIIMQISAATKAQKITLSTKNASIFSVFDQISEQSGYDFIVTNSILKKAKNVTIQVKDMDLAPVLKMIFKDQPLEFTIDANKTVLVKQKESSFLDNLVARFRAIDITGKIVDEKGLPLPGATVSVKGAKKQTQTNPDGVFNINDVEEDAVLVISFLGYQSKEISASKEMGTITLMLQASDLEQVVISTGYQTLPKERVTGSFSTVSSKKLDQQRLSNLGSLLEGRIPGYNNGLIRGTSTMQGVTAPLYVIDGFPVENTNYDPLGNITDGIPGLNLEDIATITVLKDAAAASIYGARAANGVIVIVTKKAKIGKPQISVSSTLTVQPYRFYTGNLTNAADVIELERDWAAANPNLIGPGAAAYANNLLDNVAYQNKGINAILQNAAGKLSTPDMNARLDQLASAGFKYYDDVKKYSKRNPFYQQYNISVGNATEKNSLYSSVTYRNNKLQDKYNNDESLGLNLSNKTELSKWLSLELSTFISYKETQTPSYNTLSPGFNFQPYDVLVNPDGSDFISTAASRLSKNALTQLDTYDLYNMDINPLQEQAWNLDKAKGFNNRTFIKLNAKIRDWLSYSPTFQYEYSADKSNLLYDKKSFYVRNKVNSFASSNPGNTATYNLPYGYINYDQDQLRTAYNFRQQFTVDKRFGEKHSLNAIAGTEIRNTKIDNKTQYLYDYDPQVLTYGFINPTLLASYPGDILGGGYFSNRDQYFQQERINRFVSAYANVGYAYDDKYLLTGSIRYDQSNLWGTSSKYQKTPIWSLGAGWNLNKESFLDASWIDLLKLRVSHGIGGNVYSDNAPFLTAYYYQNYNVGGLEGGVSSRPNPLLSWEKTTTTNGGLDFAFLGSRISGSLDYYYKQGTDLLANTMGVPTEGFGYSTYSINNGEMINKGVELNLAGDVIRSRNLTWNLGVQYAFNKNKVSYVNVEAPVYYLQLDYPQAYPRVGNPYNAIYSYKWAGLNDRGLPQVYNENGEKVITSPGTLESIVYSGTTVPKYSGSVNSSLDYKGFVLSLLLTFEGGHKLRNSFIPMLNNEYNGIFGYVSTIGVVNNDINDRWRNPGDENRTNVPRAVFAEDDDYNSESYNIYRNADINVLDASNIRMRNISLAYNLPTSISKKLGAQSARFQFNVENAFTIAKSQNAKYLLNGYMTPNYVWGVYLNF